MEGVIQKRMRVFATSQNSKSVLLKEFSNFLKWILDFGTKYWDFYICVFVISSTLSRQEEHQQQEKVVEDILGESYSKAIQQLS